MEGDRREFYGVIEMLYILVVVKVYSFASAQQNVHFIACKYISELF